MKILIVEDDADMRDLLRLILERSYYVPILASQGKEGVEKAISEKPKLILMDIRMPIMDGWERREPFALIPTRRIFRSWQQPCFFVLMK